MATTKWNPGYSARWMAKLKADPVRYEAYLERTRARDRARGNRVKSKSRVGSWNLDRITAKAVEGAAPSGRGHRPNRPVTESKKIAKEVYHLTQAGEKVQTDRIESLRDRRDRNRKKEFEGEIDSVMDRLLKGQDQGAPGAAERAG